MTTGSQPLSERTCAMLADGIYISGGAILLIVIVLLVIWIVR
jgi:hypothetical protein